MYPNYYYQQPNQMDQYKQQYINPYAQQNQMIANSQATTPTDGRIWVNGEKQAMDYLVAPGGFVQLWDVSQDVYYEKRADASGKPFLEIFDYYKRGNNPIKKADTSTDASIGNANEIKQLIGRLSVTEKEISSLRSQLRALEKELGYETSESDGCN